MENKITTPVANWGYSGAMCFHWTRQKYPKEYKTIYRELNPIGFKKAQKREQQQEEKDRKMFKKVKKIEENKTKEFKKLWENAGGE